MGTGFAVEILLPILAVSLSLNEVKSSPIRRISFFTAGTYAKEVQAEFETFDEKSKKKLYPFI